MCLPDVVGEISLLSPGQRAGPRKKRPLESKSSANPKKLRLTLSPQGEVGGSEEEPSDSGKPNNPNNSNNPNADSRRKCGHPWCRQPGHTRRTCPTKVPPPDWDEKKKAPRYLVVIMVCAIVIKLGLICIEIGITIIVSTVQSIREKIYQFNLN